MKWSGFFKGKRALLQSVLGGLPVPSVMLCVLLSWTKFAVANINLEFLRTFLLASQN